MNIYTLSFLFVAAVSFISGHYVYLHKPGARINRSYFYLSLLFFFWSLQQFIYQVSDTIEFAELWDKYTALWIFVPCFLLHFILIFTRWKKLYSSKYFFLLTYAPGVCFFIYNILTGDVSGGLQRESWGWSYKESDYLNVVQILYIIWGLMIVFFSFGVSILSYRQTSNTWQKDRTKLILFGFVLFVVLGLSSFVLDQITTSVPDYSAHPELVFSMFIAYGIIRYNLFVVNPATVADTIVSTMVDALIIINPRGIIIEANHAAGTLFHCHSKDLLFKHINEYIHTENRTELFFEYLCSQLSEKASIKEFDSIASTPSENRLSVSLSASKIIKKDGTVLGTVIILRDITERKSSQDALKKAYSELERINKVLIGRELAMIKLKKKCRDLESSSASG